MAAAAAVTVPPGSTADSTEPSAVLRRQSGTAARTDSVAWACTGRRSAPEPGFQVVGPPADTGTGTRDTNTGIRYQRPGRLSARSPARPNRRPVCPCACPTSSLQLYKVLKNNPKTILHRHRPNGCSCIYMVGNSFRVFQSLDGKGRGSDSPGPPKG